MEKVLELAGKPVLNRHTQYQEQAGAAMLYMLDISSPSMGGGSQLKAMTLTRSLPTKQQIRGVFKCRQNCGYSRIKSNSTSNRSRKPSSGCLLGRAYPSLFASRK
jgi:hypothetical protein